MISLKCSISLLQSSASVVVSLTLTVRSAGTAADKKTATNRETFKYARFNLRFSSIQMLDRLVAKHHLARTFLESLAPVSMIRKSQMYNQSPIRT